MRGLSAIRTDADVVGVGQVVERITPNTIVIPSPTFNATTDTAAINYAINLSGPGDIVQFGAGTYAINAAIILLHGRAYVGAGQEATIIRLASGSPAIPAIFASAAWYDSQTTSVDTIEISDMTIHGNVAGNTGSTATGIVIMGTKCSVRRVSVLRTGGSGIRLTSINRTGGSATVTCAYNRIENCQVKEPESNGIIFEDSGGWLTDGYCVDNIVENARKFGITSQQSKSWVFRGNHLLTTAGFGMSGMFLQKCSATRVTDNYIDHFGESTVDLGVHAAIRCDLTGPTSSIIANNVILAERPVTGSTYYGVHVFAVTGTTAGRVQLTGNSYYGMTHAGEQAFRLEAAAGAALVVSRAANRADNASLAEALVGSTTVVDAPAGAGATDAGVAAFISGTGASNQAVKDIRDLILARDTFDRADGAIGVATTGQTWTVLTPTPSIVANKLTGTYSVMLPSIATDVDVSVTLTMPTPLPGGGSAGILISELNLQNLLEFSVNLSSRYNNQFVVGAGLEIFNGAATLTAGAHTLRFRRVGRVITSFFDGVQVSELTVSQGTADTLNAGGVGLRNQFTGATMDNLVVRVPTATTSGEVTNAAVALRITETGAARTAVIDAANADAKPFAVTEPLTLTDVSGTLTLAGAGGGAAATTALARKYKSANDQALASFANSLVTLNTDNFTQAGTAFQTIVNGIKVLKTGLYGLEICLQWASGASGVGGINLKRNGVVFGGGFIMERTGVGRTNRYVTLALTANDEIGLESYLEGGGTLGGSDVFGTSISLTYFGAVG